MAGVRMQFATSVLMTSTRFRKTSSSSPPLTCSPMQSHQNDEKVEQRRRPNQHNILGKSAPNVRKAQEERLHLLRASLAESLTMCAMTEKDRLGHGTQFNRGG